MAIMKETDRRFVSLHKRVGAFVLLAIVGLIIITLFMGRRLDLFTAKKNLYLIADSGHGFHQGQMVKLSGFEIGKVKKITMDDRARVKVELSMDTKYMKWIKMDSWAVLTKEGFIGDNFIEITPGSAGAKEVLGDAVLSFYREKGLGEIAQELKGEITPALRDINRIIAYINDPNGDIKQTLANIRKLSSELPATKQHIDALIQNTNKHVDTTTGKVDAALDSARQSLATVDNTVKKIDKEMPVLLDRLNKGLEKADKSLENVHKITDEIKKAAPAIPSLTEKGEHLMDGTKEIVDSVKKTWPIRSFIEKPEEKTLKVDSYE
jgi:phospholipid/cholesterol/gamma-HCH transport system substrate-binding protein